MPVGLTEVVLEQAIIDKFTAEDYTHITGDNLHREYTDVLIEEDLTTFLASKYASQGITTSEINSIIRSLRYASATPLYSANKLMFHRMVEGETFVREDRSAKDFHLRLIDFDIENNKNIVKIVNQMTIKGPKATRRPDAIVYINGLPVVVMEFKSAIKEDTTIHDAYVQITTRYMRDIPELFKYNCFAVISDPDMLLLLLFLLLFVHITFLVSFLYQFLSDYKSPFVYTSVQTLYDTCNSTWNVLNYLYRLVS